MHMMHDVYDAMFPWTFIKIQVERVFSFAKTLAVLY
jgi:hypothetical protein